MKLDKALLDKYNKDSVTILQMVFKESGIPFIIPVNEKGLPNMKFQKAFEKMGEQYLKFAKFQYNF